MVTVSGVLESRVPPFFAVLPFCYPQWCVCFPSHFLAHEGANGSGISMSCFFPRKSAVFWFRFFGPFPLAGTVSLYSAGRLPFHATFLLSSISCSALCGRQRRLRSREWLLSCKVSSSLSFLWTTWMGRVLLCYSTYRLSGSITSGSSCILLLPIEGGFFRFESFFIHC